MPGFLSPMEKVKRLVDELRQLEAKLGSGKPIPLRDQVKIQNDIKRIKEEIARLERRVC
ncbi:MAG: hypothetical protein PHY45_02705 [Rhodocyclaceae bacterium]|nr:hypothetical protein [Rhodocyclaceae bacterium]